MKRVVFFLLIGIMLSQCLLSMADTTVTLKPGPDDLTQDYLRDYAATFYARKCGLSKETLMQARMDMALWQSDRIRETEEGKKVWELVGEPEWYIHVQSFPGENGQHQGFHLLRLTRVGELISWSAHGGERFVEDPDMMRLGSPATPLPTDATEDDILSKAQDDLKTLYDVDMSDTLRFKTAFITHALFNDGRIPVWLVGVYEDDVKTWKGLYSYKGQLLSLVPAQQDYTNYQTPDEVFFTAVYDNGPEADKLYDALYGRASEEELIAALKEVGPKYEEWKRDHPYADNYNDIDELLKEHAELLK